MKITITERKGRKTKIKFEESLSSWEISLYKGEYEALKRHFYKEVIKLLPAKDDIGEKIFVGNSPIYNHGAIDMLDEIIRRLNQEAK